MPVFSMDIPISTQKGAASVVDGVLFADVSDTGKWRTFDDEVKPGTSIKNERYMKWSVSPGEATVLGDRPEGEVVDLTHVRAMFRLTGADTSHLINRVCGLDLDDAMFPNGAAARTLFASVATEIVRDDVDGELSYLILPSRSFSTYIKEVIEDASLSV